MIKREQEVQQIIQNIEILLNNLLPVEMAGDALEAYQDARFILDIELLRVFQACLKTIGKNGVMGQGFICESLLRYVTDQLNKVQKNNDAGIFTSRLQKAEKAKTQLLNFPSVSDETVKENPNDLKGA